MLKLQNVVEQQIVQNEKEEYIMRMLIRTLYSNDVTKQECKRIVMLLNDEILDM